MPEKPRRMQIRFEDAIRIVDSAKEAGLSGLRIGERHIPLEEIKEGIMKEGAYPYAHFVEKLEEAVQRRDVAQKLIKQAKEIGIDGVSIGNCRIPLEEIERGSAKDFHAYQDAVRKLEITLQKTVEAFKIINRAKKVGVANVRFEEKNLPIDQITEEIRSGNVFAHRHVLRHIGNALRRARRIADSAPIKEIEYLGKKIQIEKESLARFLIEHGVEHAKAIRAQIIETSKRR